MEKLIQPRVLGKTSSQKMWCLMSRRLIRTCVISCRASMRAKSLQSCLILCNTMGCSPPGSSVHGILKARILEWVAMPSSRGSSQPRDRLLHCRRILYHWATRRKSIQSRWWFSHSVMSESCDPTDCSSPGSSVHRILQERILEWVVISPSTCRVEWNVIRWLRVGQCDYRGWM